MTEPNAHGHHYALGEVAHQTGYIPGHQQGWTNIDETPQDGAEALARQAFQPPAAQLAEQVDTQHPARGGPVPGQIIDGQWHVDPYRDLQGPTPTV